MQIQEFVNNFKNHPVIFIGTGFSLRYLYNSYSWDSLLKKIASDFQHNEEYYLGIKSKCKNKYNSYDFDRVASYIENDFNTYLENNRYGEFEHINDIFFENMRNDINISRFKLYIAELLKNIELKENMLSEITELKKARKNIGSVITTNYDCLIEKLFSFEPLIGNNILLSNPYGALYKIHGCVTNPDKIIITETDYQEFEKKYELIRAQLLSLFIHNPIIFIGYSMSDKNIKDILKTIFSYVDHSSQYAKSIRDNFLLIEYEKDLDNTEILEHDIDIEGFSTIRINKLKTDNFIALYQALSNIVLSVSAMDIRKVQSVVRQIYSGTEGIKVLITEDLDNLKNSDKVLAIGSKNTIKYDYQTTSEMMINYFQLIEESNSQLLALINKQKIQKEQFFPIFGFSAICEEVDKREDLKKQQHNKINSIITNNDKKNYKGIHKEPNDVDKDDSIPQTYKTLEIILSIMNGTMNLESVEFYLRNYKDKRSTNYRKILCAYDIKKYNKRQN